MELPSKILEQIAFITGPKIADHMLIVMNRSTHEENLSEPLQTHIKHFKNAVTFLTGCNGVFNVTNSNNKLVSRKQLPTAMILFKILILKVLMKLKA